MCHIKGVKIVGHNIFFMCKLKRNKANISLLIKSTQIKQGCIHVNYYIKLN